MRRSFVLLSVFAALVVPSASQENTFGSLLPANGKIAFVSPGSNASGNTEIHLIGASGRGESALTRHGPTGFVLGWIADGRRLMIEAEGGLSRWSVNPDGSGPRRLRGEVTSPSGRFAASRTSRGNIVIRTARGRLVRVLRLNLNLPHRDWHFGDTLAWSPDERRLAYDIGVETDRRELSWVYVINVAGRGERRLSPTNAQDTNPAWSPDGQRLLFESHYRDLYVMRGDGSERRTVAAGLGFLDDYEWSPHSDAVAWSRKRGIYFADLAGGRRKLAATAAAATITWSPDARSVAFNDLRGLKVVSVRGGLPPRMITRGAGIRGPAWSPRGQLAFERALDTFVVSLRGGRPRPVTRRIADSLPTWSPDGTLLEFVRTTNSGDSIYVVRADGSGLRRLGLGDSPDWSADGRNIVYVRPGTSNTVVVSPVDGGAARAIGFGTMPQWSPDGRHIAFVATASPGECSGNALSIVTAEGSTLRTLSFAEVAAFLRADFGIPMLGVPTWSPDGKQLADDFELIEGDPCGAIVAEGWAKFDLEGPLQPLPGQRWGQLSWSPAGDEIAYVGHGIGVIGLDSSSLRTLVASANDMEDFTTPTWAPDGTTLLFAKCNSGSCNLLTVGRNGTGLRRVAAGHEASWQPLPRH